MYTSYFVLTLTSIKPPTEVVFNLDFLRRSSLMGTTLRAAPSKSYICHFDKLSCIYCNAHMIFMYTYFVLTSINLICSCFVHIQQHGPPQIVGAEHPCCDRNLLPCPRRGLRGIVFTLSVCVCLFVCVSVCPANILVFYLSAIRRDVDLKFIQDTYRVVLNS